MRSYMIAERYAGGLSAAIADSARLESVLQSLMDLRNLYETEHDLRTVLGNQTIEIQKRAAILDEVLDNMEVPKELARFAQVLLKRGRIPLIDDVEEIFATIVDKRLNRIEAKVTSAVPLSQDQKEKVTSSLEAFSGKTVRTTCKVDPEVLGGVVARIGSTVIDGSLRSKLDQLKHSLLSEEM